MTTRTLLEPLLFLLAALACWIVLGTELLSGWAEAVLLAAAIVVVLWIGFRLLRRSLWRVGRRLAFSYFLIGIVPIPIVALLAGLTAYLASGFFLGHVYRDTVAGLHEQLDRAATTALASWGGTTPADTQAAGGFAVAYYRDGRKVGGAAVAPEGWPAWLDERRQDVGSGVLLSPFVALPDGTAAMVGRAQREGRAVLTLTDNDLEPRLSETSGVWVQLLRSDDPRKKSSIELSVGERSFSLLPITTDRAGGEARLAFFDRPDESTSWLGRPWLWWGELTREFRSLATGESVAAYVAASLNGTLDTIRRHLFSGSAEVDTAVWFALLAVSSILTLVYLTAAGMAILMIVGLSRAVNQLSRATRSVREGDFSVRLETRRRDQLGELQQTFDEMTAGLDEAVRTAAQQEALESELATARELQRSLLPEELPAGEGIEFASLFEPSAAIGGDYFDVLRLDEDRLAVVIADVAGHGLPSGLRMAMLKSALDLLLSESHSGPVEIFQRLHHQIQRAGSERYFVTASIGLIDLTAGSFEVTNAGHPPVYLLRDEAVEEILVPGSPLGLLGGDYGRHQVEIHPGDVLVWLSDGLFEATGPGGEPFGYARTEAALAGAAASATQVRDRLIATVDEFRAGVQLADDRTVVVMRYLAGGAAADEVSEREPPTGA